MKTLVVEEFVPVVREFLDEVNANDSEFLKGDDSSSLDAIIKSKIIDAANYVNLNADFSLMRPERREYYGSPDSNGVIIHKMDGGVLRLISAYVEGWSRAVTKFVPSTIGEYAALKNPVTTGYPDNPKAGIEYHQIAGDRLPVKYLELYSSKPGVGTNYFLEYVSAQDGSSKNAYGQTLCDVPDTLVRAVACYAAGLTLITLKDEHAETFINMANSMIEAANTKCIIHGNNI